MNTKEEKNLLQYQFEKLDNAIIYRLNAYVFTDNPMWKSERMVSNTLYECQGIASAAMWLNFIDYNDYLQICKILRECEWRIRHGL